MKKVNGAKLLVKRMPIIKAREEEFSVELTKSILAYFDNNSTGEILFEHLVTRYLCKGPQIVDTTKYSKYPYSIKSASLIHMLLRFGVDPQKIVEILPE